MRLVIVLVLLLVSALPAEAARKRKPGKRRAVVRVSRPPAPVLSPAERAMLLRSFSNADIERELAHRLLTLYTLTELQAEASRRGLR